jgi:hypothetical protein
MIPEFVSFIVFLFPIWDGSGFGCGWDGFSLVFSEIYYIVGSRETEKSGLVNRSFVSWGDSGQSPVLSHHQLG